MHAGPHENRHTAGRHETPSITPNVGVDGATHRRACVPDRRRVPVPAAAPGNGSGRPPSARRLRYISAPTAGDIESPGPTRSTVRRRRASSRRHTAHRDPAMADTTPHPASTPPAGDVKPARRRRPGRPSAVLRADRLPAVGRAALRYGTESERRANSHTSAGLSFGCAEQPVAQRNEHAGQPRVLGDEPGRRPYRLRGCVPMCRIRDPPAE